jgi:hypothetical protein
MPGPNHHSGKEFDEAEATTTGCLGFLSLMAAGVLAYGLLAIGATPLSSYGLAAFLFIWLMSRLMKEQDRGRHEREYQQYAAIKDERAAEEAKKAAFAERYTRERGD